MSENLNQIQNQNLDSNQTEEINYNEKPNTVDQKHDVKMEEVSSHIENII